MTEELWAHTAGEGEQRTTLLCHAAWPAPDFEDDEAAAEINWLIDLVSGIRSVRSEMNVPPAAIAPLVVLGADATTQRAAGAPRGGDQAAGARRRDQPMPTPRRKASAQIVDRRGDVLPAARQPDRPHGRGGAPAEGTRQGRPRRSRACTRSCRTRSSSPTRRRKSWRPSAKSLPSSSRRKASCKRRCRGFATQAESPTP